MKTTKEFDMAVFDAPVDAHITEWKPVEEVYTTEYVESLRLDIENLKAENLRLDNNGKYWCDKAVDLQRRIDNAAGVIRDYISENGEVSDELEQIAEYLGVSLTKRISGTAIFEISWSANVPLDFDADDFEISFDADCDTYVAEDFDWQEENTEVNGQDDDY